MKAKSIKTLSDLKDSRLLYEKDLPLFGYGLILLIIALLIAVLCWSLSAKKQYIIKGSGTVESANKNYLMSPFTGELTAIHITEGQQVDKGQVLFTVKSNDIDLQLDQLVGQIRSYQTQIAQAQKLTKSIKDDHNYFSATKEDDNLYYSQYETYKSQTAQQKVDIVAMKSYGYTKEQIAQEIQKSEKKIAELYYNALREAGSAEQQAKAQLETLESQKSAMQHGKADYKIKANATGKIHMVQSYKKGMVVQAGSAIAGIAAENDDYIIQASITAADRARISVGDKTRIEVAGLAQSLYGTIPGKVMKIDSDITTDAENKQSYFKMEVKPDSTYLIGKEGNKVNLSNGMAAETRTTYEELTYFDYTLEALGVLVKQ